MASHLEDLKLKHHRRESLKLLILLLSLDTMLEVVTDSLNTKSEDYCGGYLKFFTTL